jgi:AhpC/TSA family
MSPQTLLLFTLLAGTVLLQSEPIRPSVTDLDGRAVDPLEASPGVRANVLVFLRTDCPIANRYAPEIERIRARFAPSGVKLWLVYLDAQEPPVRIRAHMAEYGLHATAIRDPGQHLVGRVGASATPEAAVFDYEAGVARLLYRGRLDDQYVAPGRRRPGPTRHDLVDAVEDTLAGRLRALRTAPAVGCLISDLR